MSVMQDLYDSEINVSISTFWDGEYTVKLGDEMNGFVAEVVIDRWGNVEPWLTRMTIEHFPNSMFALMYRDGLSAYQAHIAIQERAAAKAGNAAIAGRPHG